VEKSDAQRELLARLLALQQQNIDLKARLDLEHQAGEGFLRFSERALSIEALEPFWNLAAEETISTFGTEDAILVHIFGDKFVLCGRCCAEGLTEEEVRSLGRVANECISHRVHFRNDNDLPTIGGRETALLFCAGYRDLEAEGHGTTFALIGTVSRRKLPFYPTMDAKLGPLFSAFANHAAALQQHIRGRVAARRVGAQMQRLAEVANRTSNAVIIADDKGCIEWVNESFERLTGWRLHEVLGLRPGSFLQGQGTSTACRDRMGAAVRNFAPFDVEIANYSRSGRQYWVQIESRVIYDERGRPSGFVAIETDVTERRLNARRDSLTQRVASLLLTSQSIEDASHQIVVALVDTLEDHGVQAAHVWTVEPRGEALVALAGASTESAGQPGQDFLARTRDLAFLRGEVPVQGVGVPGTAWGTGKVWFETNLSRSSLQSRRLQAAVAAGIDGLCAAPIVGPDAVLGVVEVAVSAGSAGFDRLPALLERVAEQIAAFLLHDQSRRAFLLVFEQSPDGMLLVASDGRLLALNARAKAMFGPLDGRPLDGLIENGFELVRQALSAPHSDMRAVLHHREAIGQNGQRFSAEISVSATADSTVQSAIIAVRDLTERHRMEAAVADSLREKETLLKEIHHRVKNNLQIISSLLMLQVDQMPSPEAQKLLEESVQRVRSMALIHQQIYGGDSLERIDLGAYASQLADSLRNALAPTAVISVDFDPIEVTVEHAVPLGLILNELITNAFKYGTPADRAMPTRVAVELRFVNEVLTLSVRDHGPGMPPDFNPRTATSLGLQLVRTLSRQLRGQIEVTNDGGACFRLSCRLIAPNQRPERLPR
jgi:PAS domain S-box-containing protein